MVELANGTDVIQKGDTVGIDFERGVVHVQPIARLGGFCGVSDSKT